LVYSLRLRKWVVVWLPFAVAGSWVSFQLQDPTLPTILQLYFPILSYTFLHFPTLSYTSETRSPSNFPTLSYTFLHFLHLLQFLHLLLHEFQYPINPKDQMSSSPVLRHLMQAWREYQQILRPLPTSLKKKYVHELLGKEI